MASARLTAVFVTALVVVAGVPAATTTLEAKSLALRQADLPALATRTSEKENRSAALPGGRGHAYATAFRFRVGRRTQVIGTTVITAPSATVARRVYAAAVSDARRSAVAVLSLPRLGDEQYAALYGRPSLDEASGLVWVRRNTVVWQIQVNSVSNPFGFSRAEAQAQVSRYALKQMRRVGTG